MGGRNDGEKRIIMKEKMLLVMGVLGVLLRRGNGNGDEKEK